MVQCLFFPASLGVKMMRKSKGLDANRGDRKKRRPKLGAYMIVTDTEKTEKLYFEGLKGSLPKEVRENLLIKIHSKKEIGSMISFAREENGRDPRYRDIWLIIDHDEFKDFDIFIVDALSEKLNVGWSNPCFEVWLSGYLDSVISVHDSKLCCQRFEEIFVKKTNKKEYDKGDESIYRTLIEFGNEETALKRAREIYNSKNVGSCKPSQLEGCTSVYLLVEEIKAKVK
jgi:hypothetical protein